MSIPDIRVAVTADIYPVPTEDGAFILSGRGGMRLVGTSIAQWLDRLLPHLNGERTLGELTAGLDADKAELIRKLVLALADRQVVSEVGHPLNGRDEGWLDEPECRFLLSLGCADAQATERFRKGKTLVLGSGPLVRAVVNALLRVGARSIEVLTTAGREGSHLGSIEELRDPTGVQLQVRVIESLHAPETLRAIEPAELVFLLGESLAAARSCHVQSACARAGTALAQAALDDGGVWLVESAIPQSPSSCWASVWRRGASVGAGSAPPAPHSQLGLDSVAAVAAQIVHDAFRFKARPRREDERSGIARVDLRTLENVAHRFIAHPFDDAVQACSVMTRIEALAGRSSINEEEFSQRAVALMDSRLGIFEEIQERDLVQMPMHVAQTRVADPVGLLGERPRPVVTGTGLTFAAARQAVVQRALASYGALMIDPRRLLTADRSPLVPPESDPAAALRRLMNDPGLGYVEALDLTRQRSVLVPAQRVWTALGGVGLSTMPPRGFSVELGWMAALDAALLQHCAPLAVAEAIGGAASLAPVDLGRAPLDASGRHYARMAFALPGEVRVYDATTSDGPPLFAFTRDSVTVAYGCGVSTEAALRDGLRSTLLHYQARAHSQLDYAPPPVPEVPVVRGEGGRGFPALAPRRLATGQLVSWLSARGFHPAAVPLDHDAALTKRLPWMVAIVAASP